MAGLIIGFYGPQRSGKTLLSVLFARALNKQYKVRVYTNMSADGFIRIETLQDIPFSYEPKILLLDEAMSFLDSRSWKDNTKGSFFFNIIGKLNILLILTSPRFNMLELRLREQHNYIFKCLSDSEFIYSACYDVHRDNLTELTPLRKTEELFNNLKYNTLQVPDIIDIKIDKFLEIAREHNKNKKIENRKVVTL